MDIYFPDNVSPDKLVPLPAGYTCISQEAGEELVKEMPSLSRTELSVEQIESIVENTDTSILNLWEIHNRLIAYVEPFNRKRFTDQFYKIRNKHYVTVSQALNSLAK